jgi:hypothetical protein
MAISLLVCSILDWWSWSDKITAADHGAATGPGFRPRAPGASRPKWSPRAPAIRFLLRDEVYGNLT